MPEPPPVMRMVLPVRFIKLQLQVAGCQLQVKKRTYVE
jgi:hypothetical protein